MVSSASAGQTAPTEEDPASTDPAGSRKAVAFAYVVSIFLSAMDTHIVNVALPSLSRDFHAPIATVQWTVIGYVLGLAMFIPASGWIGDRFGTKRIFMAALALFTAASALCGQAHSIAELIGFRLVQGIGGGTLIPTGTAMLYRAYRPQERARMARLLIMPVVVAPATAPVVGGLLIDQLSWRWAFYVNVPVGVLGLVIGGLFLKEQRQAAGRRFDLAGFLLSGSGLAAVLYAISEGPLLGWTSPKVVAGGIAGAALLAAFVRLELRTAAPILDVRLLHDRLFRATNIVFAWNIAAFLGLLYLVPIFLQEVRGQSPLSSGLTTFVEAIGVVAGSQTIGHLYPRIGPRRMTTAGCVLLGLAACSLALVDRSTDPWTIRAIMFTAGFFNSATLMSVQASMFTRISPADTGHASAIYNTQRQSSLAIGIAVLSAIVSGVGGGKMAAFHAAFVATGVMALVGGTCGALLVHDADARATMGAAHQDGPGRPVVVGD